MTTLPPPGVDKYPEDSIEKKVYNMVEELGEYIPVENDKNRLAFCLYKYVHGEGDEPKVLVHSAKINVAKISKEELAEKLEAGLNKIK